ncbi:MAG: hypothetical protein ACO2ZE_07415, partial [Pseudohongiellaceae bacterium]
SNDKDRRRLMAQRPNRRDAEGKIQQPGDDRPGLRASRPLFSTGLRGRRERPLNLVLSYQ